MSTQGRSYEIMHNNRFKNIGDGQEIIKQDGDFWLKLLLFYQSVT